jgi:dCMP deaminase
VGRQEVKDETFLLIAQRLAYLGTCDRKRVGAVITRDGRCVSWGYNGAPPGMPHCEETIHGWEGAQHPDWVDATDVEEWWYQQAADYGCRASTHAEANALAFAARQGISTDEGTVYVTVSPCVPCARLLVAAGIERVVFHEEYRELGGISVLEEGGVTIG